MRSPRAYDKPILEQRGNTFIEERPQLKHPDPVRPINAPEPVETTKRINASLHPEYADDSETLHVWGGG